MSVQKRVINERDAYTAIENKMRDAIALDEELKIGEKSIKLTAGRSYIDALDSLAINVQPDTRAPSFQMLRNNAYTRLTLEVISGGMDLNNINAREMFELLAGYIVRHNETQNMISQGRE